MKNELVSVIIPIHNGERLLERSLRSVFNQTYKNIEVITILNNCSDRSEEICKNFNTKILYCKDQGIVPTLNTGLLEAKGKYIARQDDDDFWYPDKLEKQITFLENNPEIDIVGTQIRILDENLKVKSNQELRPLKDKDIKNCLLNSINAIAHPSVVFRKKILKRIGMYSDLYPFAEDYEMWLKCIKWFNFYNLSETLIDYTHSHNIYYNPRINQLLCKSYRNIYLNGKQ